MKEKQPIKELESSQIKNDDIFFNRLILVVLIVQGALMAYTYKDSSELKDKCIAERIIDEHGNPGPNFNFETEDPQQCDIFMPSKYLPGRKREIRGRDIHLTW